MVSESALRRRASRFGVEVLAAEGFLRIDPLVFERKCQGLSQGVEFLIRRPNAATYSANVYWRYEIIPPLDEYAMDFRRRLSAFGAGPSSGFALSNSESFERDWETIEAVFRASVLPFLDRFSDVPSIVSAVAEGELTESDAYGADAGWRLFNKGLCLLSVGDIEAGCECLRQVVELDKGAKTPWRIHRGCVAEETATAARVPDP